MGGQGLSERGGEAVGVTSAGIRRIPFIESLLGARVVWCAGYGPLDAAVASIAGFRAAVSDQFETESRLVVQSALFGVADVEFEVVGTVDGEGVVLGGSGGGCG